MDTAKVDEIKGLAQIAFAQDALRGIVLLNGGALISLLALFGQVWSKDSAEASIVMISLRPGLLFYLLGTIAGIIAQGAAYLSQQYFVEGHHVVGIALRHVVIMLSLCGIYLFAHASFSCINSFIG
ncbi:MAG: hypothetical protein U5S82_03610 [Gammaproteobacteria bacterium]|nr:hypothetical protein [Gammaproteobacteria bacterium]